GHSADHYPFRNLLQITKVQIAESTGKSGHRPAGHVQPDMTRRNLMGATGRQEKTIGEGVGTQFSRPQTVKET
ncbi:MAG TPA: hypothetical protein VNZ03_32320, partial [Terriglobales bacterium]|nr:hypothetical protein [Terriglobales bacterium]